MKRSRKKEKTDVPPDVPLLTPPNRTDECDRPLYRDTRVSNCVLKPPNLRGPFHVIWHKDTDRYIVTDESGGNVKIMNPDDGTTAEIGVTNGTRPCGIVDLSRVQDGGKGPTYIFSDTTGNRLLKYQNGRCEASWGDNTLKGRMQSPAGLALSPNNCLYIADSKKGTIHKVDSTGHYLGELGEGHLKRPRSIAVDRQGNIYIADETAFIRIITAEGTTLNPLHVRTDGKSWICRGVATDQFDNIFVTAYQARTLGYPFSNEKVMVFDSEKKPVCSFGGHWYEFHNIRGISFDYKRNRILVVDGSGRKLNIYKLYDDGQ